MKIRSCLVFAIVALSSPVAAQELCRVPGPGNQTAYSQCPPGWDIYVGGIFLQRGKSSSAAVIIPPTGTPGVVVNASDFSYGFAGSLEYMVRYRFADGWSIEGRYFDNDTPDATFLIPNITTFRVAGIGVTILGGGSINSIANSELKSAELNLRKQLSPGFSVLAGYRYLAFDDFIHNDIATTATFTQWRESNRMHGAQLGVNYLFASPDMPLQFNVGMKGGFFANSIDNTFSSTIVSGATGSASKTAFMGEVNLTATYFFTPNLKLQAGYTFLYLDNVGLAGETAQATTQIAGGTSSPVNVGSLWYHGATLRLGVSF